MADDDADDPTTLTDEGERAERAEHADGASGIDDEARPPGGIVQLQRRRPRRRRGSGRGSGAEATGPAGRWSDDLAAGDHEPTGGSGPGDDRHAGDGPDDAASPGAIDGRGATDDTRSAGIGGVIELTTLRGRRDRGGARTGAADDASDGDDLGTDGDVAADAPVAALHPRMRRRRIAVRRSEGLRRLRRLTWGLAGLALLVDGMALAHTGFVDVDGFEIAGSAHTSAEAVRHASGIHGGDALLTLDEAGAERRIEALPWVAEADVVRQWPGTVRITVVERQPSAVLQVSDDPAAPLALVDATGRVLEIGAHPEGLIAVTQVPAELEEGGRVPAEARDALRIAEAASRRMPGTIVSLTVGLEATLGGGGVVLFGSVDDLDVKLMALSTVLARVDLECLASLNLTVPDHPALERSC